MTSNDILLSSEISALLCHHQKCFLLQQMGTKTELNSQTLRREQEIVDTHP